MGGVFSIRCLDSGLPYLDGKIRATHFAEFAANAKFGMGCLDLAVTQDKHLSGAECDAYIASLAPAFADDVFESSFRLFAHILLSHVDMPLTAGRIDSIWNIQPRILRSLYGVKEHRAGPVIDGVL